MVMVSYINKLRNSGMELNEAVITGAIRPVSRKADTQEVGNRTEAFRSVAYQIKSQNQRRSLPPKPYMPLVRGGFGWISSG